MGKTAISLDEARRFLKNDPHGRRLQAAEHALALLRAQELPHLRRYIFNATFSLRQIVDFERLEQILNATDHADTDGPFAKIQQVSSETGCIKIHFDEESLRVLLLYKQQLSDQEAMLFSRSLSEVTTVAYAALGLDMTGLLPIDSRLLDAADTSSSKT